MNDWELFSKQFKGFRASKRRREALAHCEGALKGDVCKDNPIRRAIVLRWMGEVNLELKTLDCAYDAFKQSIGVDVPQNDRTFVAEPLSKLGDCFASSEMPEKAVECCEQSRPLFGDDPKRAWPRIRNLNLLAGVYLKIGKLDHALSAFDEAVRIAGPSGGKVYFRGMAALAAAFKNAGRFGPALRCADMILRNTSGEPLRISALNTKGIVLRCLGRNRESIEAHEATHNLLKDGNNPKTRFHTVLGLGQAYAAQGQWEDARGWFAEALDAQRKVEELKQQGSIKDGLDPQVTRRAMVTACLNGRNLKLAEKYAGAVSLHASVLGPLELARARKAAKYGEDPSAHLSEARQAYEALLEDAKTYGLAFAFDPFAAKMGLGAVHELQEDYTAAETYYRDAVDISENMRSSASKPEESERFFNTGYEGFHRLAPYEGLERVLFAQERYEEALLQSEYTKARSFLESLAGPLDPNVRRSVGLDFMKPTPLKDSALQEDEWVLAYNVTETGLFIHLLHGKALEIPTQFNDQWGREKLKEEVKNFRAPLDAVAATGYRNEQFAAMHNFDFESGKTLADILVPSEIMGRLKEANHVTIVPDEFLGLLPFEMLVLKKGSIQDTEKYPICIGAEFFGDHRSISYYHSISALTASRWTHAGNGAGTKALLIANPAYSNPDWLLPDTANVKEALDEVFPGASEVFLQERASKEVFETEIKDGLSDFSAVVFGVHGNYSGSISDSTEPELLLGPDKDTGRLTMSDVMSLKMNADLVALVACNSGMGETLYGEGVMGMGRAFQCAGARNVLMSLWSVVQESSVELVNHFLCFRAKHGDAEALKLAREALRRNPLWDHPLFWAPFVLVGDGGRMNRTVV